MTLRALLLVVVLATAGCAGDTTATKAEPTERQRANAEKQEALQEMLQRGQRN